MIYIGIVIFALLPALFIYKLATYRDFRADIKNLIENLFF